MKWTSLGLEARWLDIYNFPEGIIRKRISLSLGAAGFKTYHFIERIIECIRLSLGAPGLNNIS